MFLACKQMFKAKFGMLCFLKYVNARFTLLLDLCWLMLKNFRLILG